MSTSRATTQMIGGDKYRNPNRWAAPVGGTITRVGDYRIHTFTTGGTFYVPTPLPAARLLVIAGGGAGARGGGGAGGMLPIASQDIAPGEYTIVVGTGGVCASTSVRGGNGGNSSALGNTAIGGGGGGQYGAQNTGASGGSGGGGGFSSAGGSGTAGQGYAGGTSGSSSRAAGGGGAGAVGTGGTSTMPGGKGALDDITGQAIWYCGGGGGGSSTNVGGHGEGVIGGGGQGLMAAYTVGAIGEPGADGIVVIRYVWPA